MKFRKGEWVLVVFSIAYIIGFLIKYIQQKNYEFLLYGVIVVIVAALVLWAMKKGKLDYLALWGLSIWGLIHMAGGGAVTINGTRLYSIRLIELVNRGADFYILKVDQVVHFYGYAVAAIVLFQLLSPLLKDGKAPVVTAVIAWLGSIGLGAINEIVEFAAFISFSKTGVGDLYNFGLDLMFNGAGALAGALIAYWWFFHKTGCRNKSKKT